MCLALRVVGLVFFRSIVTNGTGISLSGVSLSDSSGETLGVSTLAAGQTVTSNAVQITALSGHHFDTASVTGTATAPGITSVVSAAETADYTAVSPSISIDDQVMVPGGTWQDVGSML